MSPDGSLRPRPIGSNLPALHPGKGEKAKHGKAQEVSPEEAESAPLTHLFLVNKIRQDANNYGFLNRFVDYQVSHNTESYLEPIILALDSSLELRELVNPLVSVFDKRCMNLSTTTLASLKANNDLKAKAALAAIVILLKPELFVSDFLVPSLGKSPYLEDADINTEFSQQMLSVLDEDQLTKLFELIDFSSIHNFNNFASSIIDIKDPEMVLNSLLAISNESETSTSSDELLSGRRDKIHRIVLLALKKLKEAKREVPLSSLKTLYASCHENEISDGSAEMLKSHDDKEGVTDFLEELINDDSDDSYEARRRRFWAIHDYICLNREKAVKGLKSFIVNSPDSFLVTHACYQLASGGKEDGKKALSSAIYEHVAKNKSSIPLAYVGYMIKHDPVYVDILRSVYSMHYPNGSSLPKAYSNLEGMEFTSLKINNEGSITFNAFENQRANSFVDILSMLGLKRCVQWALEDDKLHTKENLLDLLEHGYRTESRTMSSLVTAALELNEPSVSRFVLGLADIQRAELAE